VLNEQAKVEDRPLKLQEVPTPHAQDREVRIKVIVCGICRTDIHIAEGDLPLKKSPIILGHEVVGVVDEVGNDVQRFKIGDRVGVYWLHDVCGKCKYCRSLQENYCPEFKATGWDVNGGFAEYITIPAEFALPLNEIRLDPIELTPQMCPGIAGYAAFTLTEVEAGEKLGLYGFGPTAYYVLKVAQFLDIETYVSTRSPKNITRALKEGAIWAANTTEEGMPVQLDAAILFPPVGSLVEPILSQLKPGGTLVMAPVSSSPIHIGDYSQNLWGRTIKTLYQVKPSDAEEFIDIGRGLEMKVGTTQFPFEELPQAIIRVKHGEISQPNAVIIVAV
jgi:propanol-preferring alcohol dehydrogenase